MRARRLPRRPRPQPQASYDAPPGATGIFSVGARAQAQRQALAPPWPPAAGRCRSGSSSPTCSTTSCWPTNRPWGRAGRAPRPVPRAVSCSWRRRRCACWLPFSSPFRSSRTAGSRPRSAMRPRAFPPPRRPPGRWPPPTTCGKLDTLRQALERLTGYHREGAPLGYRWGLYAGDDLYPEARRIYFARFQQLLLLPDAAHHRSVPRRAAGQARSRIQPDLRRVEGLSHHHLQPRQEHPRVSCRRP